MPMEVCKIVEGQRYSKRLNERQINALLRVTCQRPYERERHILQALKEGDKLMGVGKLREAVPFYEKVMKDLVFQNELHGMAALQWSICQDSLSRPNEARVMYEKLQSHPNVQVSKKAKQFVFSFQAMETMKVTGPPLSRTTGYETYFDAFIENKDNYTTAEEEQNEGGVNQIFPYLIFLVSPIFFVLFIAARKSLQL